MYRGSSALVRCCGCAVELPAPAAALAAEGHLCGRCGAARFAERAVILVLGAVLAGPIVAAAGAALTLAWVAWLGAPSFAVRAGQVVVVELGTLAALALGVRAARSRHAPRIGPSSGARVAALAALVTASIAGTVASPWLYAGIVRRIAASVATLMTFSQDTATLALLALGLHAGGLALLFTLSVWRWQRRPPPAPPL